VVPFYKESILPLLRAGHNVLVVGHGNSLRALVKYIERISDDAIAGVEIPFGAMMVYAVDTEGYSLSKEVRKLS
jgi:2,3-bisphosphoglycerate-dependent phosphoglycerate mutase